MFNTSFRMKQLPKAEYRLMQAMIEKYTLDDPCELFTCLLRMGYEIIHMQGGTFDGESYWLQQITTYRNNKTEHRDYELPG